MTSKGAREHSEWDLSKAAGWEHTLSKNVCGAARKGMERISEMLTGLNLCKAMSTTYQVPMKQNVKAEVRDSKRGGRCNAGPTSYFLNQCMM